MKKVLIVIIMLFSYLCTSSLIFAKSSYVLPYPSTMPGGISYKLHILYEKIQEYWYFGDLGQFTYNLKRADKYLVEAKTLFEYHQYLLGVSALEKSNMYFQKVLPSLEKAQQHGKNIKEYRAQLQRAAMKHEEVLQQMLQMTPEEVIWNPEKGNVSHFAISKLLEQAIVIRQKYE